MFIDANLAVYNTRHEDGWWPNIMQQTMIRAQTKLEFAWGLATRMADAINAAEPRDLQHARRDLDAIAEFARAAVFAAEAGAHDYGNGVWCCDLRPLAALRAALPMWFPRVNEIIRLIGSHNLLRRRRRGALADPKLRPLIDHYLRGAGVDAEQRAGCSGWPGISPAAPGSRNEQYERFYLGSGGAQPDACCTSRRRSRAGQPAGRPLPEGRARPDAAGVGSGWRACMMAAQ